MSGTAIVGIVVFVVMTVAILLGVPICVAMMGSTFVGFMIVAGFNMTCSQFTNAIFELSKSYSFAVIPLFMIVGSLAGATGIAEGTFRAAKVWLGKLKGGLLYTVIYANMIFGACSGISAAGNIVFSKIAMPELEKANYDRSLCLGTITAAGSMSVLIPPSIPIISFCLLTNVSVGAALVTGISTGILFAVMMTLTLKLIGTLHPEKMPVVTKKDTKVTAREKFSSLKLLLPIAALFALIVGGSFLGWFPATVGGAIACVAIFVYAIAKRMPMKKVLSAAWEGVQGFAGIYMIMIAGQFFSRFITMTGLASALTNVIANLHVHPFLIFCIVLVFYLFCGCFMDCLSIIIITVPIVFPLLHGLGYHELVLVIVLVFVMELASLSPPIGVGVFNVANALNESTGLIFKGVMPYFLMDIILVLLIALAPQLILWLPRLMGY